MRKYRNRYFSACTLGLVALLCACAGVKTGPVSSADETALRQRAETYWSALISHDFLKSYTYESPGYRNDVAVKQYYAARIRAATTSAEVGEIVIKADLAQVLVTTGFTFPGMGEQHRIRNDYWKFTRGEWYHLLTPSHKIQMLFLEREESALKNPNQFRRRGLKSSPKN